MRAHRGLTFLALAGVAALTLTACSSDNKDDTKDDSVTIASILGLPDYASIDYQEQERQLQELVAVCMREEGWEYTPVEYPSEYYDFSEPTDDEELERIQREGLGVTYWTLHAFDDSADVDDPFTDFQDPNLDYLDSLSQSEQEAYYVSLYGEPMSDEGVEITALQEDGGCYGKANVQVRGDDPSQDPAFWDAMAPYYDDINDRYVADSRYIEINKAWSACMKDAGYDFTDQNAFYEWAYSNFDARQQEVLGDDFWSDPTAGWTQEQIDDFFATATAQEQEELFAPPKLTDEQRTALQAIHDEEVAIAVAEFNCSKGNNAKLAEVYSDVEATYALEHEDELRALAASLSAKK